MQIPGNVGTPKRKSFINKLKDEVVMYSFWGILYPIYTHTPFLSDTTKL
jgi:hypothetical protein